MSKLICHNARQLVAACLLALFAIGCAKATEKEACLSDGDCDDGVCVAGFCEIEDISDAADRRSDRDAGRGVDQRTEDGSGTVNPDAVSDRGAVGRDTREDNQPPDLHDPDDLLDLGEPCRWDDECAGGYCLWTDDTMGSCSQPCDDDCPSEYTCVPIDVGDTTIDLCVLAEDGCDGSPICLPEDVLTETDPCGACGEGTTSRTRTCNPAECTWNEPSAWSDCVTDAECSPTETRIDEQPCGNCGTESRTGTCNSTTCRWNPWPVGYGPCTDQGVCAPRDRDRDQCGACHEAVCNDDCEWECSLWGECDWDGGTHWRCCDTDMWQFCLGETYGCVWSDQCVACTDCGCE